jgi:hypothetical protein
MADRSTAPPFAPAPPHMDHLQPVADRLAVGLDGAALQDLLRTTTQPLLLRGLVAHWPAVQQSQVSPAAAAACLREHDAGATVGAWRGPPRIDGRFFYDADFKGFNFQAALLPLQAVLDELERQIDSPQPSAIYVGSTTVDTALPGFRAHNDLPLAGLGDPGPSPLMSVWIGNRARIAAHHDVPDNLACVVAGRRRFTLFPPAAVGQLYIGPLDFTPAGQAISLVDFAQPDFEAFPKFADALRQAQVADLAPGDALFIPSLWWHHVEALAPLNVLINYWWRAVPPQMDSPMHALLLALMTVRDLPPEQRQGWRQLFEHYVFEADAQTAAHLPEPARGLLASPLPPEAARAARARLLKSLNR